MTPFLARSQWQSRKRNTKFILGDFLTVQEGRTEADRIEAHLLKEGFRPMSEEEISYYKEKGLLGMPEE